MRWGMRTRWSRPIRATTHSAARPRCDRRRTGRSSGTRRPGPGRVAPVRTPDRRTDNSFSRARGAPGREPRLHLLARQPAIAVAVDAFEFFRNARQASLGLCPRQHPIYIAVGAGKIVVEFRAALRAAPAPSGPAQSTDLLRAYLTVPIGVDGVELLREHRRGALGLGAGQHAVAVGIGTPELLGEARVRAAGCSDGERWRNQQRCAEYGPVHRVPPLRDRYSPKRPACGAR